MHVNIFYLPFLFFSSNNSIFYLLPTPIPSRRPISTRFSETKTSTWKTHHATQKNPSTAGASTWASASRRSPGMTGNCVDGMLCHLASAAVTSRLRPGLRSVTCFLSAISGAQIGGSIGLPDRLTRSSLKASLTSTGLKRWEP